MKSFQIIRILSVASCLCLLPSCGLINSVLKIPVSILKTVTRTVGISNLTDSSSRPVDSAATGEAVKSVEQAASAREQASGSAQ